MSNINSIHAYGNNKKVNVYLNRDERTDKITYINKNVNTKDFVPTSLNGGYVNANEQAIIGEMLNDGSIKIH